jgi:hypothetical protein
MGDLDAAQRRILETIGWGGIEPEKLLRDGRDFQEVERRGLVVFWPFRGERPRTIYGGAITPGRWYLTVAGAAAIGLDSTPLRLS